MSFYAYMYEDKTQNKHCKKVIEGNPYDTTPRAHLR